MAIEVRKATAADLPAVVAAGAELHAASGLSRIAPLDREYAENLSIELLQRPDVLIAVAYSGGQFLGVAMVQVDCFFFSPSALYVNEWLWWVAPEYRERGVAARLLDFVVEWAKGKGAKFVTLSEMAGLEGMGRFAGRHGSIPFQQMFIRRIA